MPLVGSTGEINKIDDVASLDLALLTEKMNAPDPLDRFYVLPLMENVENIRAETVFFEWNSGQKVRIRQGARTFTASLPNDNTDTSLLKRLQAWYGQAFGVYIIDQAGNWVYQRGDDGDEALYPIPVDGNSFDVNLVTETYAEPLYTMLQFDFKNDNNDGDLFYVGAQDLDFDGRSTDLYGLWDLTVAPIAATTSEVTFSVATSYGVPLSGLVAGDVTLHNNTTDVALTVDTLTESVGTPGSYTLDFTGTATAADELALTIAKDMYAPTTTKVVAA